jgi:hypothetical protein
MRQADLPGILAAYDEPVYLCGDGYELAWSEELHSRIQVTPAEYRLPHALSAAWCAAHMFETADDSAVFTAASLTPVYLRKTQAEREREERLAAQGN